MNYSYFTKYNKKFVSESGENFSSVNVVREVFDKVGYPLNENKINELSLNISSSSGAQNSISLENDVTERVVKSKGKKEKKKSGDFDSALSSSSSSLQLSDFGSKSPLENTKCSNFFSFTSPFSSLSVDELKSLLSQQFSPYFLTTLSSLASLLHENSSQLSQSVLLQPVPFYSSLDLNFLLYSAEVILFEERKNREKYINLIKNGYSNSLSTSVVNQIQNSSGLFSYPLISSLSASFFSLSPLNIPEIFCFLGFFCTIYVFLWYYFLGEILLEIGLFYHSHQFFSEVLLLVDENIFFPNKHKLLKNVGDESNSIASLSLLSPSTKSSISASLLFRANIGFYWFIMC
jgi:hypothetical protein